MVYYCSVKGCKNNSKMKKKDPDIILSFHAFPVNETSKQKWLRAIGRPSWRPPSFARICSTHFDLAQISHEGCRIRMMEDACPVYGLPPNSNFEASDVEVCRMCLGTDMKMFSLQEGLLNTCLQSFVGLKENCSIEGMPQFICYECSARLISCYNLVEQSCVAQAVLLDLFTKNGQVTKSLVKAQDRKALGLESSLQCCNTTEIHQYIVNGNDTDLNKLTEGTETTHIEKYLSINIETDISERYDSNEEICKRLSYNELEITRNGIDEANNVSIDNVKEENTENVNNSSDDLDMVLTEKDDGNLKVEEKPKKIASTRENLKYLCQECDIKFMSEEARRVHLLTSKQHRKIPDLCEPVLKREIKCSKCNTQFPTTAALVAHARAEHPRQTTQVKEYPAKCEHCEEMLNSRSDHWLHVRRRHPAEKHSYSVRHRCVCQRCGKRFQNSTKLHAHELRHSAARLACPRCARAFHHKYALARHAATHAEPAHACPLCPRAFTAKHNLARHQRVHTGETPYTCNLCDKRFKHSTSLSLHVRSVHCNEPPHKRNKLTENK